jgi:DNA-binding NarL/FixJ family response regulator
MMRLLLAEQHTLLRTSIAELIRTNRPDWELAQASDLAAARERLAGEDYAVLLIGIDLVWSHDLHNLLNLRIDFPSLKMIVRCDNPDRGTILSCFRAGALACVVGSMSASDLLLAIRCVASGEVAFSSAFSEFAPPRGSRQVPNAADNATRRLTYRQSEVLSLLEEGRSTKEIARCLDLSVGTIKVHLASIYRTLGARNRVEAAIKAVEGHLALNFRD